jgi:uncharacterized protein (DUF1330 family)
MFKLNKIFFLGGIMKAYIIGRGCVNDKTKAANYMPLAKEANEKFGGKYLARGGKYLTKEGKELDRNVIIEFPSFEKAKAAYESEEYKKALQVLDNGMDRSLVIVEGIE